MWWYFEVLVTARAIDLESILNSLETIYLGDACVQEERIAVDICRNAGGILFQRGGTATVMERLENLSDEVTEGRSSVRVDEDWVERGGWMVNN